MRSIETLDLISQENIDPVRLGCLYDLPMEIKEWILTARSTKKMTQTQLGEAMGVTKGNVSAWENGRHEPSWSQMLRISELTGVALPLPTGLQQGGKRWPFTVDQHLFESMPLTEREKIDEYVEYMVNKWHASAVKSPKSA